MEYFSVSPPYALAAENTGRVPAFVFSGPRKGEFQVPDGRLEEQTGADAVKQWFELMLRQQPGKLPIYPERMGIDRTILNCGYPEGFVKAEVERNVRETATYCPSVRTVGSFSFKRLRHGLEVSFLATLHTGETVEVTTDVNGG